MHNTIASIDGRSPLFRFSEVYKVSLRYLHRIVQWLGAGSRQDFAEPECHVDGFHRYVRDTIEPLLAFDGGVSVQVEIVAAILVDRYVLGCSLNPVTFVRHDCPLVCVDWQTVIFVASHRSREISRTIAAELSIVSLVPEEVDIDVISEVFVPWDNDSYIHQDSVGEIIANLPTHFDTTDVAEIASSRVLVIDDLSVLRNDV